MAYQSEIEKLEQRYEENPQQWFAALADAYRKDGSLDLALEYVRGGLEMRPNYASGYIALGRCLIEKNEHAEAAQAFEQVLDLDAENIIALKSLSEIAELRNDFSGATSWLERLLEVDPMNDEARETLERLVQMPAPAATPEPPAEEQEPLGEPAVPVDDKVEGTEVEEAVPEPAPATEPGAAWAAEAMSQMTPDAPVTEPSPGEDLESLQDDEGPFRVEQIGAADPFQVGKEPESDALELETSGDDGVHGARGLLSAEHEESPIMSFGDAGDEPLAEELPRHLPDEEAEEPADAQPEETEPAQLDTEAVAEGHLEVTSFDDSLEWDTGERLPHEMSPADIVEAEEYKEDLAPAVDFLGVEDVVQARRDDSDAQEVAEPTDDASERDTVEDVVELGVSETESEAEPEAGDVEATPGAMQFVTPEVQIPVSTEADTQKIEAVVVGEPETDGEPEPVVLEEPVAELAASEPAVEEPIPHEEPEVASAAESGFEEPVALEEEPMAAEVSVVDEDEEDIPLIMPDEEEATEGPEPRPVVTETMAEVYAQQGLYRQARQTYQKLLAERPEDAALQARFDELTERVEATAGQSRSPQYSIAETGGSSAVTFLQQVFAGQLTDDLEPLDLPVADEPPTEWVEPATSTLESAFGEEPLDSDAPGSPTVPAADEVSLSSIFGEGAAPPASAPGTAPTEQPPRASGGVSFDEFYGQSQEEEPAQPEEPEADAGGEERSEDDFRDWLEGLKT